MSTMSRVTFIKRTFWERKFLSEEKRGLGSSTSLRRIIIEQLEFDIYKKKRLISIK